MVTTIRPRLLACDVDGTLFDPDGRLRPLIREALYAIRDGGVSVVLASGRSPWGLRDLCEELDLDGPQITMQGGLLASPLTGIVLRARTLGAEDVREHRAFAADLDVDLLLCFATGYRAERLPSHHALAVIAQQIASEGTRLEIVPSLCDIPAPGPIRTLLLTGPRRHAEVLAATKARFGDRYSIVWADDRMVELLAPATNKGTALQFLAGRLGLNMHDVAAVGDAPNDIEMLQMAGRSAAMGSAPEEVRVAADFVVAASSADGAHEAFRRFFPRLGLWRPAWQPLHRWTARGNWLPITPDVPDLRFATAPSIPAVKDAKSGAGVVPWPGVSRKTRSDRGLARRRDRR